MMLCIISVILYYITLLYGFITDYSICILFIAYLLLILLYSCILLYFLYNFHILILLLILLSIHFNIPCLLLIVPLDGVTNLLYRHYISIVNLAIIFVCVDHVGSMHPAAPLLIILSRILYIYLLYTYLLTHVWDLHLSHLCLLTGMIHVVVITICLYLILIYYLYTIILITTIIYSLI